ncbi:MAG: hypothetical protein ABSG18_17785 [Steroidobacteraceae bacterium]|jgi:hypothetical protein
MYVFVYKGFSVARTLRFFVLLKVVMWLSHVSPRAAEWLAQCSGLRAALLHLARQIQIAEGVPEERPTPAWYANSYRAD